MTVWPSLVNKGGEHGTVEEKPAFVWRGEERAGGWEDVVICWREFVPDACAHRDKAWPDGWTQS
jgi:hypothetical protein